METTIKSRNLGKEVTFSRPGKAYVYVDLNGQPGTLGYQICRGGGLSGSTITYNGEDPIMFKQICKRWFAAYCRFALY